MEDVVLDLDRFEKLGIIINEASYNRKKIQYFTDTITTMKKAGQWNKKELVDLFFEMIPNFEYVEKGKYLDAKM
jgi:flagellar motor switch protein FliG